MILASAVSGGIVSPVEAWPDFFSPGTGDAGAFPASGSDMTGFRLEQATPQSFAADLAAMVRASGTVTLREPPAEQVTVADGHSYVPDAEWT